MYYGGADKSGVQPMILPQDTTEAARQAITPQAPGSEFTPTPHPDIARIAARLKELEKLCTAVCDKLYMYKPGAAPLTYMEREDLHEELAAYDKEKAGLNKILEDIYEGSGSDKGDKPPADPYKQPPATIIGEDRAPGSGV